MEKAIEVCIEIVNGVKVGINVLLGEGIVAVKGKENEKVRQEKL